MTARLKVSAPWPTGGTNLTSTWLSTTSLRISTYEALSPDSEQQPEVINGASDLLVQLYGDTGRHARSAVGMGDLPREFP